MNTSSVPFRGPCIDFRCVFRSCPPACHPRVLLRLCAPPPPSLAVSSSASACWIRPDPQALPPAPSPSPPRLYSLSARRRPRPSFSESTSTGATHRVTRTPFTPLVARSARAEPCLSSSHPLPAPSHRRPLRLAAARVDHARAATSLTARVYERRSPRPPALHLSIRPPHHQHSFGARSDRRKANRAQARSRGIRVEG